MFYLSLIIFVRVFFMSWSTQLCQVRGGDLVHKKWNCSTYIFLSKKCSFYKKKLSILSKWNGILYISNGEIFQLSHTLTYIRSSYELSTSGSRWCICKKNLIKKFLHLCWEWWLWNNISDWWKVSYVSISAWSISWV